MRFEEEARRGMGPSGTETEEAHPVQEPVVGRRVGGHGHNSARHELRRGQGDEEARGKQVGDEPRCPATEMRRIAGAETDMVNAVSWLR